MDDALGAVSAALAQLRADHGRLRQYDAIERCAAQMQAVIRRQGLALRAARAAIVHGIELTDNCPNDPGGLDAEQVQIN